MIVSTIAAKMASDHEIESSDNENDQSESEEKEQSPVEQENHDNEDDNTTFKDLVRIISRIDI